MDKIIKIKIFSVVMDHQRQPIPFWLVLLKQIAVTSCINVQAWKGMCLINPALVDRLSFGGLYPATGTLGSLSIPPGSLSAI